MRRDLLQPTLPSPGVADPHAVHQLSLADIDRSHPGNDLILLRRRSQHRVSSPLHAFVNLNHVTVRGSHQAKANLVLVLDHNVGNNEGPTR
jgi:hypothetical protein